MKKVIDIDKKEYDLFIGENYFSPNITRIKECLANSTSLDGVLDEIRSKIDLDTRIQVKHYTNTDAVIDAVLDAIDKYRTKEVSEQIVIELDKDIIESLNDGVGLSDCQYKSLIEAITNSTPLPKEYTAEGENKEEER